MSIPASEHSLNFVLVHGAWHGGWCWKRVSPLLRALGHEVFTPTLTGLGERQHLMSPEVGLDTHIKDVLGVLEYEDLHDVILVGHSYAGMVIAGVAEKAAERIAHLVYLDAFVPADGKSLADYQPPEILQLSRKAPGRRAKVSSYRASFRRRRLASRPGMTLHGF